MFTLRETDGCALMDAGKKPINKRANKSINFFIRFGFMFDGYFNLYAKIYSSDFNLTKIEIYA